MIIDLETPIPFGKYKGMVIEDILEESKGLNYMYWLFSETKLRPTEDVRNLLSVTTIQKINDTEKAIKAGSNNYGYDPYGGNWGDQMGAYECGREY